MEYFPRDYLTWGTPPSALKYKRLAATGMKPEGKLLIRKKGGIFLYQNPSIAQCKSEKHADEYEVTDLN